MQAQRFTGSVETSRLRDKIPGIKHGRSMTRCERQGSGRRMAQDCDRDAARIDRRPQILEG